MLAPYAVDVIVHRDHRGRKIANRAFQQVVALAKEMGLTEVYLETHQANEASIAWAAQLSARRIKTINACYYPRYIYRYDFNRALKVRGVTRELVGFIPELAAHRQLLNDLFDDFYKLPITVEWWKDKQTCKFDQTLDQTNKQFRLDIGVVKCAEPLSIIWSLAHEYGHSLQPKPTAAEQVDG